MPKGGRSRLGSPSGTSATEANAVPVRSADRLEPIASWSDTRTSTGPASRISRSWPAPVLRKTCSRLVATARGPRPSPTFGKVARMSASSKSGAWCHGTHVAPTAVKRDPYPVPV